jgi:hypothetical protein
MVRTRIVVARAIALERQGKPNAVLSASELRRRVRLSEGARTLLAHAVDHMGISGRAHDRLLKLALTISDLEQARRGDTSASVNEPVRVTEAHVAEALSYRIMDRRSLLLSPDDETSRTPAGDLGRVARVSGQMTFHTRARRPPTSEAVKGPPPTAKVTR